MCFSTKVFNTKSKPIQQFDCESSAQLTTVMRNNSDSKPMLSI